MDAGARPAVATTCPYCGVGCGVLARVENGGVAISGDPNHPANRGRLCSKGAALGETLSLEGRLLHPQIHGRRTSWGVALDRVADAFASTVREHGPDAVALYVSGQLLTEDYYVANKFIKGFIGTANIDTNSRLCMASSVAGHKRAFGADTVPGTYEDLEEADLLVLVGSNLAWCHPVLFQRVMAAKAVRPQLRIVTIDPRATATTVAADLHLGLAPDTDVALFLGLLRHLSNCGSTDANFVAEHTAGFEAARAEAARWTVERVAAATGCSQTDIATFFRWVADTDKTVTVYSQGVNQSASGTDKVNAIINTHLLTGRIGRLGTGPFSVTGQPNAMGGREVGGLANMLAAHMEIADPHHRAIVQRHWACPTMPEKPGLKAVEMFDAVRDGRIKALWIMATNPAASMPEASCIDEALARVPFLAVSDVVSSNDTLRHAHVALPAAAWAEKDGTVTNSERRISRQRGFLPLPGEARPDWAIIAAVAQRMGFSGFDYQSPHEIFDEHARLSDAENGGTRDFDIGGLAGADQLSYDRLAPVRWPVRRGGQKTTRFFANGGFYTPDRRAHFVATAFSSPEPRPPRFPFVLNTGRVRDQWHTMTRTGRSGTLSAHLAEPFAEVHPADAAALQIEPACLVELKNYHGRVVVRALVTDRQREGSIFAPIHWTDETSANARVDKLVAADTDPVSGQPASKFARVAINPYPARTFGFAVSTRPIAHPEFDYWTRASLHRGMALEFASLAPLSSPSALAESLLGRGDLRAVTDDAEGAARYCAFDGERLVGAVYLARRPVAVSRAFVIAALGKAAHWPSVLAGRPAAGKADPGATVCACFQVGANTIRTAIANGATTVDAVGTCLGAGTNCGSCRSDIQHLINSVEAKAQSDDARITA